MIRALLSFIAQACLSVSDPMVDYAEAYEAHQARRSAGDRRGQGHALPALRSAMTARLKAELGQ